MLEFTIGEIIAIIALIISVISLYFSYIQNRFNIKSPIHTSFKNTLVEDKDGSLNILLNVDFTNNSNTKITIKNIRIYRLKDYKKVASSDNSLLNRKKNKVSIKSDAITIDCGTHLLELNPSVPLTDGKKNIEFPIRLEEYDCKIGFIYLHVNKNIFTEKELQNIKDVKFIAIINTTRKDYKIKFQIKDTGKLVEEVKSKVEDVFINI